jgi:hypothetical protein
MDTYKWIESKAAQLRDQAAAAQSRFGAGNVYFCMILKDATEPVELSPIFGDDPTGQAAAVVGSPLARSATTSNPSANFTLRMYVFRAADGVRLPIAGGGDFGTSPFLGNSSDKPVLASVWLDGGAGRKAQQG